MIVDTVQIFLKAGKGGEGASTTMKLSARKIIGGGGDGGRGGDVILRVNPHLYDLSKFRMNECFTAEDGWRGKEYNKNGRRGKDLIVDVPAGTLVCDLEGNTIVDLDGERKEFLVGRGGAGGRGNYRRPQAIPAHPGQEREVILDYRIPADAVILGLPNTGKTALFNKLTGKSCKVADYPFTTTSCVWAGCGKEEGRFVVLDTPPLKIITPARRKENAFLKHLRRAKVILWLSDCAASVRGQFRVAAAAVNCFDASLLNKKKNFYLLTKIDKIDRIVSQDEVIPISVKEDRGIEALRRAIGDYLKGRI